MLPSLIPSLYAWYVHAFHTWFSTQEERESLCIYSVFVFKPGDPLIIVHPESQTRVVGERVTLRTEAKGTVPLHFTWLHNNRVVEGVDSPVLALNAVTETDSGSYVCQVENQVGRIVSKPAELQVGKWQNFGSSFIQGGRGR